MASRKRLLILDDEEFICLYLKKLAENIGWQVFTAATVDKALEIFKKEKPQGCILDIHLIQGDKDGKEALKEIRKLDKRVNCVMVTRIEEEKEKKICEDLGANGYYLKPLDTQGITELIKTLEK